MQEAADVAARFCQSRSKSAPHYAHSEMRNGLPAFYIFNTSDSYVVVSGDKRMPPVLAFSDEGAFDSENIAPAAQMWLDYYSEQIHYLKVNNVGNIDAGWLLRDGFRDGAAVAPLLHSKWGQGEPYNYYCPRDIRGDNSRCVTGCVATALGQIMYYFGFPESGVGSYTYQHPVYGELSADYESAVYDFSAMCDKPAGINTAISRLIYDCGVGMDMDYGPDGSGVHNHSAGRVLREHFKYSPNAVSVFRDSTTLDWDSLLVAHLDRRIPLYYAGWSVPDTNGHGFVCDGYQMVDSNYYFHFNFGWEGSSDGYFYTDALNVSGSHFNLLQEIVANAYPDTALYEYPVPQPVVGSKTLTARFGTFTDGSADGETYAKMQDFTWNILPDLDNLTGISVELVYDLADGDTLFITSETASNAPRILTADSAHLVLSWTCSDMTFHFVSDSVSERSGFRASYQAIRNEYCNASSNISGHTGHVEDGSGASDYAALTCCKFAIKATGSPSVNIHFTEFDLEDGHDFLYVYKNAPSGKVLLETYTGQMPDTTIFFVPRDLLFVFETDEFNNAAGFAFDFEGTTGIRDNDFADLQAYPNPARETLFVQTGNYAENTVLAIFDVCGRMLHSQNVARETEMVDVLGFANGVYFVKLVRNGKTLATRKMVVQH